MERIGFEKIARESALYPQEQLVKVKEGSGTLFIGIPKETSLQENRLPMTPEGASLLVANGHEVWVEAGAGKGCKYNDNDFSDAGAKIVYDTKEVYQANMVMKVEPPTLEEIKMLREGCILISALQIGNQQKEYIRALNQKKILAVGYELIEDRAGDLPAVRAMSEIAGSMAVLTAAEYLSKIDNGRGVILGGVSGVAPTKVVILGAGTVAEYAARAALGLGAQVQVFDNQIYKLRRLRHILGQQIYTATIDSVTLADALETADVAIGAKRADSGRSGVIVTEEMVANMKPDAIIVDVSIDQGGNFETSEVTTHEKPVFRKLDVIHYCVPNMASRVPRTATQAFNNIFTPLLIQAGEMGGLEEMIFRYPWIMNGVYTFKGACTNQHIARKFGLSYKDLSLFGAARL